MMSYGMEYPFGQFGLTVLILFPPSSLGPLVQMALALYYTALRGYKEVVRMCREKTRKAKAQPELNLAIGVKENKKIFFTNILIVRGGIRRISILYWMWRRI